MSVTTIPTAGIANGAVDTAQLADDAVTAAKAGFDPGKIGQIITATYSTITSNTSTTHADTGLTASITPSATSSKIYVVAMLSCYVTRANAETYMNLDIVRGSTIIYEQGSQNFGGYIGNSNYYQDSKTQTISFLDSPSTTSSTTYKITFAQQGGGTATVQNQSTPSTITLMEVLA
tara:strand:+ start:102 stop:629 length:528 start_codon:yes stop_codon:yes gene_type:complete